MTEAAEGASRRGVAIGLALVVALGAAVGVVARNGSGSEPKDAFQWERAELGADGRTLVVSYLGGRCVGDNTHIEGGHPTFQVDDRRNVVVVTLRGDKLTGDGICAGVGLELSATVVLPRAVEPAVIADGACDPHSPRGIFWRFRYRSRNPLPTDPPPDDPCVAGSPRVRSAVPDTCTKERTPAGTPRVAPSVTLEPNGDGVTVAIELDVAPGDACHLDDFYSPDISINLGSDRHDFGSTPSWGVPFRADVDPNGAHFRAEWDWANWCGPDSDVYASVATLSPGNIGFAKSNTRPPCHDPAAPNVLTLSQPFRHI